LSDTETSEGGLPYEIGRGTIELVPGLTIEVVTLNTGQAVITEDSFNDFLNFLMQGNTIDAADLADLHESRPDPPEGEE